MNIDNFLNYFRKNVPDRWMYIQKAYENNTKTFGEVTNVIISNLTDELLSSIFKLDLSYDSDSEVSIIKVIMQSGIHQEVVFRFFYYFLQAMKIRDCHKPFKDWYIPNPFSKQELSSRIFLPKIHIGYDKEEAEVRGVIIDMQNPPKLSLMPRWGVSQSSHGDSYITTYKRCRAHIDISIKIRIQKKTEVLKALCIGVYDDNNRVIAAARIWQWRDNSSDFEIPVEFDCELETVLCKMHRVYFYWEGSTRNYSYLNRLAYRKNL